MRRFLIGTRRHARAAASAPERRREEIQAPVRVTAMTFDADSVSEMAASSVADLPGGEGGQQVVWIHVEGIHDPDVLERIGRRFDLHPLLVEDIASTEYRPKVEDYGQRLFTVMNVLAYNDASGDVSSEQVSIVLGPSFVLSFEESPGRVFEPIRERIRDGKGRLRSMGADYLAYALIDAVVDGYFEVEEKLGERIEDLEDELVTKPDAETVQLIYVLKRQVMGLRRSVWPLREAIMSLQREESPLIQHATTVHLRDVYDHTIQVIDTIENFRDLLSGMLDLYLSSVSNRMNEVMKVLTIIATIFMPLTFIAGLYGMNFRHMPELLLPWGYPVVLAAMVIIGTGMLVYFRRRKWL
jgi:magnesium transporter